MRKDQAEAIDAYPSEADVWQGVTAPRFQGAGRPAGPRHVGRDAAAVLQPVEPAAVKPLSPPQDLSQIVRSRPVVFIPTHLWRRLGRGLTIGAICIVVFGLEVWLLNQIPEARPTVLPTSATPLVSSEPVAPTAPASSGALESAPTPQPATSLGSGEPARAAALVEKMAPANAPRIETVVEPRPNRSRPVRETVAPRNPAVSKVPVVSPLPVVSKPTVVSKPIVASKPPVQASVAVKRAKATEDANADATVPPTSFKGAVGVESSPEGARVFVDRKLVGFTPIVVPDLVAGSHVIRVETDTHESWTSVVRVVADEVTRVAAQLRQPASR